MDKAAASTPSFNELVKKNLHYVAEGEGELLILISGLGGQGNFWRKVSSEFAETHRVVTFDHPGVGKSTSFGPQSIGKIVDTVLVVADMYGADRFTCLGHSTGGLVAQALALDHADRVRELILSSTWAQPNHRFRQLFELRRHLLEVSGADAYRLIGQLFAYSPEWFEQHLASSHKPAWCQGNLAINLLQSERIDMLLNYQRASELPGLSLPTLIIDAPDDLIVPQCHADELQRLIPQAIRRSLLGGHFTPITNPCDYSKLIKGFINRHD